MGSMTAGVADQTPAQLATLQVHSVFANGLVHAMYMLYLLVPLHAAGYVRGLRSPPPIDAVLCWLAAHQAPSAANETAPGRDPCCAWKLCFVGHGVNT